MDLAGGASPRGAGAGRNSRAGRAQVEVGGGIFFEAEEYDGRPWYGDAGFAVRAEEPPGSAGAVLVGMYKPGAVSYKLSVPAAGEYQVWLRCAVPGDVTVWIGANTTVVVTDDHLEDAGALTRHPSVVLPNRTCLSDRRVEALTAYVKGGGGAQQSMKFLRTSLWRRTTSSQKMFRGLGMSMRNSF